MKNEEEMILYYLDNKAYLSLKPEDVTIFLRKIVTFVEALLGQKKYSNALRVCEKVEQANLANDNIYLAYMLAYLGFVDVNLENKCYVSAIAGCDIALIYVCKIAQFREQVLTFKGMIYSKRAYAYACIGNYSDAEHDVKKAISKSPSNTNVYMAKLAQAKLIYETSLVDFIANEPNNNYVSCGFEDKMRRGNLFKLHRDNVERFIGELDPTSFEYCRFQFLRAELFAKCNFTFAFIKERIKIGELYYGTEPLEEEHNRIKMAAQFYIDALNTVMKKALTLIHGVPHFNIELFNEPVILLASSMQKSDFQILCGYLMNAITASNRVAHLDDLMYELTLPLIIKIISGLSKLCSDSCLARSVLTQSLSTEYQTTLRKCLTEAKPLVFKVSHVAAIESLKQHLIRYPDTNIYAFFNIHIETKLLYSAELPTVCS